MEIHCDKNPMLIGSKDSLPLIFMHNVLSSLKYRNMSKKFNVVKRASKELSRWFQFGKFGKVATVNNNGSNKTYIGKRHFVSSKGFVSLETILISVKRWVFGNNVYSWPCQSFAMTEHLFMVPGFRTSTRLGKSALPKDTPRWPVPRAGIEPGTPGLQIPDANHSATARSCANGIH